MTDIVISNFDDQFPIVESSLQKAIFVAIDTEFSGLRSGRDNYPSLFDTNDERYKKLKGHVQDHIIIQFGFAAFHYDEPSNTYTADVFNFYLFPHSIEPLDCGFMMQASSVEFLCRYGFDFNKMIYEGIPFVPLSREKEMTDLVTSGALLCQPSESDSNPRNLIEVLCCRVAKWVKTAAEGDSLLEPVPRQVLPFLLHYTLRFSIPNIWTEDVPEQQIRILRVSPEARADFEKQMDEQAHRKEAVKSVMGFSRVFSLMCNLQVPIVGHNLLMDLLMLYKQFMRPLPESYHEFKEEIHANWDKVYDTKLLCFAVKRNFKKMDVWDTSLPRAYEYLSSEMCTGLAPNPPSIKTEAYNIKSSKEGVLDTQALRDEASGGDPDGLGEAMACEGGLVDPQGEQEEEKTQLDAHFHEAGWDAFCSGYILLRLAHIHAYKTRQLEGSEPELPSSLRWCDLLGAVKPFENMINITRGQINYMHLAGQESSDRKPPLLHVQARGSANLDIVKLEEVLTRYSNVDISRYHRQRAYVAVPNVFGARDILRHCRDHVDFRVEIYTPLRHSRVVSAAVWVSAVACLAGGVLLFLSACRR